MFPKMQTHILSFDGELLRRGFWLYIWRIMHGRSVLYYVGRTGDSSSRYASSPISRMGQHLSIQDSAAANMLIRHLRANGLDPCKCKYRLIAIGPLFPEQPTI